MQEYLGESKYFEYLKPNPDDKVYDRGNEYAWKTQDGIVCSVPKEVHVHVSIEEQKLNLIEFQKIFGKEKMFMITVINPLAQSNKETRDYNAALLPEIVDSLAVINHSSLGRMAINLFLGLRPPTYKLKIFSNAESAFEWIREMKTQQSKAMLNH